MSVKITDNDNSRKLFQHIQDHILYVGVFAEDDSTLFKKAIYNEYGTANIKKRSFIRSTFDENVGKVQKLLLKRIKIFLDSGGSTDLENTYNALGILLQGKIKNKITNLKTPPNKKSTIKAKGSSNPLIDTGQLRRRIDYEVHNR